jgi:hypothetical protein
MSITPFEYLKVVRPEDVEVREEWLSAGKESGAGCGIRSVELVIAAVLAAIANDCSTLSTNEVNQFIRDWERERGEHGQVSYANYLSRRFLRKLLLKPKPVVPDAIKGMMWDEVESPLRTKFSATQHNADILAAYEAGRSVGK